MTPDIHDLIERLGAGLEGLPSEPWESSDQIGRPGHGVVAQVFAGAEGASVCCLDMTLDPREATRLAMHLAQCTPSNIRALLSHIAALSADLASAKEALERLVVASKLLAANAEGCAMNHYGDDYAIHGLPGWIVDCLADIDAARTTLRSLNKEDGRG